MARLGDVFSLIRNGASIKQTDGAQGIPITRIETISLGKIDRNKLGYADIFDITKYKDYILKDGDILMSHINSEKHLGKTAIYFVQQDERLIHGMNLLVLRANSDLLIPKYAFYYFNSPNFLYQIPNITKKSVNQASFTVTALKELTIPVLPFKKQQKIVAIFDLINNLIEDNKTAIKKLDNLIKSRFIEMFGDPVSNPYNWNEPVLSDVLFVIGGYAFKSENFKSVGIPVLRIGNINTGHFSETNMVYWEDEKSLDRYKIYPGDLVMSLTGTVGKDDYGNVCILGNDYSVYYLNQRNAKLELTEYINKYYLSELLKFPKIKRRLTGISRGVRQANISNKDILNLKVPLPPLALQEQFATFVESTDKLKFEVKKSLEKLETLKKSLMQEYFG